MRSIDFGDFSVPVVVGVFDSEAEGQKAATMMTGALQDMVGCKLVRKGPDGRMVDMDGSVADVLIEMGIVGFQHHVRSYDVRSNQVIQVAQPTIIVPR